MMFGPTQVAASISTRVVLSETSEIWPPMMPAMPLGPSASHTSAMSEVERALDAVERGHRLAVLGAPDDDPAAAHLVEVERVQRLAGGEHHVVGDVDDVRDRPLTRGRQALLQPRRRRADLHVLEHARGEAQADLGVGDLDAGVVLGLSSPLGSASASVGSSASGAAGHGVQLARDAVDAHRVGPVRRDLELEHLVGDRQVLGERRAGRQVRPRAP